MFKGQVEIFAILGVIIVAVIVVMYTFSSGIISFNPVPEGVAKQQELVKASLTNFITAGVQETLFDMSLYGGYPSEDDFTDGVEYFGRQVPYWQKNGVVTRPLGQQIYSTLSSELVEYINENVDDIAENFDKNVRVDKTRTTVTPTIHDDRIDFSIYLPVYVEDYLIPQPLTVSVPTKFGEILTFSDSFVQYVGIERPFETWTIASTQVLPIDNGFRPLPLGIWLVGCGEYYMRTWFDFKDPMAKAIENTVYGTYMPGKAPKGQFTSSSLPRYTLPKLNLKDYSELDVSFVLPSDYEISMFNFDVTPDPVAVIAEPLEMTGLCSSDVVAIKYQVTYPVIVNVEDTITGNVFRFAFDVMIKDNLPDLTWSGSFGSEQTFCGNTLCDAKIKVVDSSGNPVSGASVLFVGCPVGTSGSDGIVEGDINCGSGRLQIYADGYATHDTVVGASLLEDAEVTLVKRPFLKLHFYEVRFNRAVDGSYYIPANGISRPDMSEKTIRMEFNPVVDGDVLFNNGFETFFDTMDATLNVIPPANYNIGLNLFSKDMSKVYGTFSIGYTITEGMDGQDLYIFMPFNNVIFENEDIDPDSVALVNAVESTFQGCGLGPIRTTPVDVGNEMCVS